MGQTNNPFVRDANEYVRDLDIINSYEKQMAHGLMRMTGQSFERCLNHVKNVTSQGGRLEYSDPRMAYVGRNKVGDREFKYSTLSKYIKSIQDYDLIFAPTLTVYNNPRQKRSVSAIYINENIKARKVAKKQMFQALINGNSGLYKFKSNEQLNRKRKANSLSGVHASDSTVLYHHTIHSSLTSTCRSASGYGNAHNEKLIAGNRHYWNADIVVNNILAIQENVDHEKIRQAMDKYSIHYPSAEEALECVRYSSDFYWKNHYKLEKIHRLLQSLDPIERAAFVYVGDLYHLRKHNDGFMRDFISKLSYREESNFGNLEDIKALVDSLNDEMGVLVSLLCMPQLKGNSIASVDKLDESSQQIIAATAQHLQNTLIEYSDFIKAFLATDVLPASVANLPFIIRRCAITSDTDSTIYTTQDWIDWYTGRIGFDDASRRIGHAISYLSSATTVHTLAKMCANMGVEKEKLFNYTMKSEFYFPVFTITSRSKTYFASVAAQEGTIFNENDYETKGRVFKGSDSPQFIVDGANQLLQWVLNKTENEEKIPLIEALRRISSYENIIFDSIKRGEIEFYKSGEIKPSDSYKLSMNESPYIYYKLWQAVFAPTYGDSAPPPYSSVKVALNINNKTQFNSWLESMQPGMAESFSRFLQENSRSIPSMLQLPHSVVQLTGVPQVIIDVIDHRQIIAEIMEPHYVVLESLGYYATDDKNRHLVSDRYGVDNLYYDYYSGKGS